MAELSIDRVALKDTGKVRRCFARNARSDAIIHGEVSVGYEAVRQRFVQNFVDGVEECAQLCIYVRGEKVVDLWGARCDGDGDQPLHGYGQSAVQNVWSTTKVLTSLVVAMLVDRGHLRYDQLVAELWPEYAQHGKELTTIAQVMRHEAGLENIDIPLSASELTADRIKAGALSETMARQRPTHVPGQQRRYHAVTLGWLVNEIVRRADPAGRTVGEFLRDEIAMPLGVTNELFIGLPHAFYGSLAPLRRMSRRWTARQCVLPTMMGGGKSPGLVQDHRLVRLGMRAGILALTALSGSGIAKLFRPPLVVSDAKGCRSRPATYDADDIVELFNHPDIRACEVPSANGHASARALAMVAATMAEGGALAGHRLLSQEGFAAGVGDPVELRLFGRTTKFTNAGWCLLENTRYDYVGWQGLGGSVLQWHPEARIGFAYAMNLMEPSPTNERAKALQRIALECASAATAQ